MGHASRTLGAVLVVVLGAGCADRGSPQGPARYRLSGSGSHWDRNGDDRVFEDLEPRYRDYFAAVLDLSGSRRLDLRPLRDDLERRPVDRRNYDALNAVAIGYFELNYRAEQYREDFAYFSRSTTVAHLLAVPWRAYREIDDGELREAVLAFFEDAASGEKLGTRRTAPRLESVVASLAESEPDAARRARIDALSTRLAELGPGD